MASPTLAHELPETSRDGKRSPLDAEGVSLALPPFPPRAEERVSGVFQEVHIVAEEGSFDAVKNRSLTSFTLVSPIGSPNSPALEQKLLSLVQHVANHSLTPGSLYFQCSTWKEAQHFQRKYWDSASPFKDWNIHKFVEEKDSHTLTTYAIRKIASFDENHIGKQLEFALIVEKGQARQAAKEAKKLARKKAVRSCFRSLLCCSAKSDAQDPAASAEG